MSEDKPAFEERVQLRAYALWEEDGRPEGQSDDHWHRAKSQIEEEDAASSNRAPTGAAKKGKTRRVKEPHPGMMGDGTEEQNLGQEGDPSARITEAEVEDAFKADADGA